MLIIFLGSMNFSILTIILSVKHCKTFSFCFIKNAAKQVALIWGQVAYYIIVCVSRTTHLEPDQVFFVSIHLAKFLPGVFAKILAKSFCQPARLFQPPRLIILEILANLPVYYFDQNLPACPFILPSPSI